MKVFRNPAFLQNEKNFNVMECANFGLCCLSGACCQQPVRNP